MRKDAVYGPLLRRAITSARERSAVVAATRALDTIEDAEEVVVGVRPDDGDPAAGGQRGELLLVERGVRADVDPAKLVDDEGRPLWTPGPQGHVRELVRERDAKGHAVDASLFELPGRTWVITTGAARKRARDAFAHPFHRPPIDLGQGALVYLRLDGPSLVKKIRGLQDLGALGAVGRRLRSVTLALPPGGDNVVKATLAYADEDAAAFSEVTLEQVVAAFGRTKKPGFSWLAEAKVDRPDKRVVVTAPLPGQLIDGLLKAGTAPDLDFSATP